MSNRRTVGIIGTGQVGMAAAYALFQQRIADELVLVDLDRRRAEGEAMDLMHAQGYVGRQRVRAGVTRIWRRRRSSSSRPAWVRSPAKIASHC